MKTFHAVVMETATYVQEGGTMSNWYNVSLVYDNSIIQVTVQARKLDDVEELALDMAVHEWGIRAKSFNSIEVEEVSGWY